VLWVHSQSAAVLGRPDTADELLAESRATGRTIGLSPVVEAIYTNVTSRAWQGGVDPDGVRAELAASAAIGRAIGMLGMETIARHAEVLLDLADGRFAEARETAAAIRGERFLQVAMVVLADLVEAAVCTGHSDEAADALAELETIGAAARTDLALGLAARCRALVSALRRADARVVEQAFRDSAEHLARTLATGELARTRLLHGEWLRRVKRRRDARAELRAALAAVEALGAAPFAARARRELRATGEHATTGGLTPQEASVAALAAGGATNVEIAERLSLSRHTVDYHLRKVFRKLELSDRRLLGEALRGADERTTHTT
jgi:DNA-binding CsgD family transcriptional regulator